MRKLTWRRMTLVILWMIILCIIWETFLIKHFNSSLSYMTRKIMPSSEQPISKPGNGAQRSRLEEIKRELIGHTQTNEVVYPANKIGGYIFLDPNLCKSVYNIDIIIIVHTATTHFDRRHRIRATFGNTSLFYPAQIRVAFLLGITVNTSLMELLWQEHRRYNDTVMGDFIDDYHNLTFKGVMGFHWVKTQCPHADFVLKIDDDVFINTFYLVRSFLPQIRKKNRSIFCTIGEKGKLHVDRNGKWKVDSHIFGNWTFYPYSYCAGMVVLLTSDLVDDLYKAAKVTPFFWVDDIYLFGLLPYVVGNFTYVRQRRGRDNAKKYKRVLNCTLTQGLRCPMYATIIHGEDDYWRYWHIITDLYNSAPWTREDENSKRYEGQKQNVFSMFFLFLSLGCGSHY